MSAEVYVTLLNATCPPLTSPSCCPPNAAYTHYLLLGTRDIVNDKLVLHVKSLVPFGSTDADILHAFISHLNVDDVKPTTVAAYVPPTPPAKITPTPPADVKPTTVAYIAPTPPANVAPKTTPVYNPPANVNPVTKKKCVPKVAAPPAQNVPAPVGSGGNAAPSTSFVRASEVYEAAPTTRAAGSAYEPITTQVSSVVPVTVASTTESDEVVSKSVSSAVVASTTAASSSAPVVSSTSSAAAESSASSTGSVAASTTLVAPSTVATSTVASATTSKVHIDIKIGYGN
ncbi:hypothetical protein HDU77_010824 [Chytriomyces hyalinus]|nr:hypothetical protein HDU77_010824 [Chytriomyces hyalinus]